MKQSIDLKPAASGTTKRQIVYSINGGAEQTADVDVSARTHAVDVPTSGKLAYRYRDTGADGKAVDSPVTNRAFTPSDE